MTLKFLTLIANYRKQCSLLKPRSLIIIKIADSPLPYTEFSFSGETADYVNKGQTNTCK